MSTCALTQALPLTCPSYHRLMTQELVRDIKETCCRVAELPLELANRAYLDAAPSMPYELPDGNIIDVAADRFIVPELLFNPSIIDMSHVVRSGPISSFLSLVLSFPLSLSPCDLASSNRQFHMWWCVL
jgi:hypothetical protein